jgi:hypothetical protein
MKTILKIFVVIFSPLSVSFADSTEVVVRSANAKIFDFVAFTKSRPGAITLAEHHYRQQPEAEQNSQLLRTFADAQLLYFEAPRAEALKAFEQVLTFQNLADWRAPQTKLLFTAALRAADLTESPENKKKWLKLATTYSTHHEIDEKVFAPPIVAAYRDILQQETHAEISMPESVLAFEILSVAGQKVDLKNQRRLVLPKGLHRFTFYSSAFSPQSIVIEASGLVDWSPEKKAWVTGTCKIHELDSSLGSSVAFVFHDSNCVSNPKGAPSLTQLKPQPTPPVQYSRGSALSLNSISVPSDEIKPWWKNKWLWLGVAGATAAYMIYDNNSASSSSRGNPPVVYE